MTLRLLHTSDWHLGALLENVPREDEHERFLTWLLAELRRQEVQVLVVAGDVFHYSQPSAEAQRAYYRFLADARLVPSLRSIVVVAGNHDSATRLEAPEPVLGALSVHVVGGYRGDEIDRCLCAIPGPEGEGTEAVVVAVPFVHELRLGVRTTGIEPTEVSRQLREAFTGLYGQLAERARELYPEAALIATGHLTCTGARSEDYTTELHQVGNLGGLPPEIFDPRYAYVALGHVHRMFPVDSDSKDNSKRIWYSGAPVPLTLPEARSGCFVLRVDVEPGGAVDVQPLPVPRWRQLVELRGTVEEVSARLQEGEALDDDALPALVAVELLVDHYRPEAGQQLQDSLAAVPAERRPRILRIAQTLATAPERQAADPLPRESLRELQPRQVFERLYAVRHAAPPRPELLAAFDSLLSDPDSAVDLR